MSRATSSSAPAGQLGETFQHHAKAHRTGARRAVSTGDVRSNDPVQRRLVGHQCTELHGMQTLCRRLQPVDVLQVAQRQRFQRQVDDNIGVKRDDADDRIVLLREQRGGARDGEICLASRFEDGDTDGPPRRGAGAGAVVDLRRRRRRLARAARFGRLRRVHGHPGAGERLCGALQVRVVHGHGVTAASVRVSHHSDLVQQVGARVADLLLSLELGNPIR
jgi:hypothetical protein